MDENINLPEEKLNIPVFRIISFDRIIEILETQKNTLTRPSKWDDPFETLIRFVNIEDNYDYPIKSFGCMFMLNAGLSQGKMISYGESIHQNGMALELGVHLPSY